MKLAISVGPVALDTETTGLRPDHGDVIRGVSLGWEGGSVYLPLTHPDSENLEFSEVAALLRELDTPGRVWIGHNGAHFDQAFLAQLGVDLPWFWDTKVGAWLENENLPTGLKERSALLFGDDAKAERNAMRRLCAGPTLKDLEDEYYNSKQNGYTRKQARDLAEKDPRYRKREMWDLTAEEMAPYAAKDAELTLALYRYQTSLDHRHPIGLAMPREMEIQRLLYTMERRGIRIDAGRAEAAYADALTRLSAHEATLEGANLNAPHEVAALVYEKWGFPCRSRTPKGAPCVDRDALEVLGDDSRITAILEARRLNKAITAYYRPLISATDGDGRIHASFNSTGTRTGRFSADHPNLQTIPREDTLAEVRGVFVPAPGFELWEYDLAQAEFRVAAHLSQEPAMVGAYAEGRDLYSEVAASLACSRPTAKRICLSYSYGAGDEKLAAILLKGTGQVLTPAMVNRAARFKWDFERTYPRLAMAMARFADIARQEGRLPLPPPGRYRHFRGFGHAPEEYRKALNSLCQGGVAELLKTVMLESQPVFAECGAFLLLQVHDSLVVEVPPGAGERLGALLQSVVDDVNPFRSVRQVVEGKAWSSRSDQSSAGSPVSISASSVPASPSPGSRRQIPSAGPSSPPTGPTSPTTAMSPRSTGPVWEQLTFWPGGSLASTSPTPTPMADAVASTGPTPVSGSTSHEQLMLFDPDGSSSRTSRPGEVGCPRCGPISPDTGMPPCRWSCPPVASALPTAVHDASWWPTPTATANHLSPSMRKWASYARWQDEISGTGGLPLPELWEWAMGFPIFWTEV